jgi:hypothetical protein
MLVVALALLVGAATAVLLVSPDSQRPESSNSGPDTTSTITAQQVGVFDQSGTPQFDAREALREISAAQGPKIAIETLYGWAETYKAFGMTCHNDAHMLGALAARVEDPMLVATYATTRCDNGYIHGILKSIAQDTPQQFDPDALRVVCSQANPSVREGCEHGIGHAIVLRGSISLTEGLGVCLKLDSDPVVAQCVTGVSMEFGVNNMIFHDLRSMDPGSLDKNGELKQLPLTAEELRDPCAPLRGGTIEGLDICYRHLHYFWSTELGRDYLSFSDRCRSLPDDVNGSCYQSMGAWVWQEMEIYADSPPSEHKKVLDGSCMTLQWPAAVNGCLHGYMHTIWQSEERKLPSICTTLGPAYEPGCSVGESKFRKT